MPASVSSCGEGEWGGRGEPEVGEQRGAVWCGVVWFGLVWLGFDWLGFMDPFISALCPLAFLLAEKEGEKEASQKSESSERGAGCLGSRI